MTWPLSLMRWRPGRKSTHPLSHIWSCWTSSLLRSLTQPTRAPGKRFHDFDILLLFVLHRHPTPKSWNWFSQIVTSCQRVVVGGEVFIYKVYSSNGEELCRYIGIFRFVWDQVFAPHTQRAYADPVEKWELVAAALRHFQMWGLPFIAHLEFSVWQLFSGIFVGVVD